MCCGILQEYYTGVPKCSGSYLPECKNIPKSVLQWSNYFDIKLLWCEIIGAIGSVGGTFQNILLRLKSGAILTESEYYNLYIKLYNSINYLPSPYLDLGIVTLIYSSVGIKIHMIIYQPYATDSTLCGILLHPMCMSNNCSDMSKMILISWFHNLDESVNTICQTI
jgi:hypothetical protein